MIVFIDLQFAKAYSAIVLMPSFNSMPLNAMQFSNADLPILSSESNTNQSFELVAPVIILSKSIPFAIEDLSFSIKVRLESF